MSKWVHIVIVSCVISVFLSPAVLANTETTTVSSFSLASRKISRSTPICFAETENKEASLEVKSRQRDIIEICSDIAQSKGLNVVDFGEDNCLVAAIGWYASEGSNYYLGNSSSCTQIYGSYFCSSRRDSVTYYGKGVQISLFDGKTFEKVHEIRATLATEHPGFRNTTAVALCRAAFHTFPKRLTNAKIEASLNLPEYKNIYEIEIGKIGVESSMSGSGDKRDGSEERASGYSTGTGFAVSSDGYIITAYHVVAGATSIGVKEGDGRLASATVVKVSETNDVALLKVEKKTSDFLQIGNSKKVKLGAKVYTVGFPTPSLLGISPKYADGSISSLSGIKNEEPNLQVSIPVHGGNSGGPLLDENGQVVGLIVATANPAYYLRSTGNLPQNISWAVKSDFFTPLLPDSLRRGTSKGRKSIEDVTKAIRLIISEHD